MRLSRLLLFSIIGCLAGLVSVGLVGGVMLVQVNAKNAEMESLMALEKRIDSFSAASNGLLIRWADAEVWDAFRADAASLQRTLRQQEGEFRGAQRAIQHIDNIVEILTDVYSREQDRVALGNPSAGEGAVKLSRTDRIRVDRVAGEGIALDTALGSVANHHRSVIINNVNWMVFSFAVAIILFGGFCMVSFTYLYRRIHGPLQSLTQVASEIEQGQQGSRVTLKGRDEFGELARTFNRMLDRQDADRQRLEMKTRLLKTAGNVARFGGWWVDLDKNHVDWSEMVAEIHELPHDFAPSVEEAINFYDPEHRHLIRECFSACVESGTPYDVELQIVTAQGRHVWVRTTGVPVRDDQGRIVRVEGAFQDISRYHDMTQHLEDALRLRHALLNSLPAHIALIDADGNVADINERWRQFGEKNGFRDHSIGLGTNYLDVCRSAEGIDSEGAQEVEEGLRSLLQGDQDRLLLDYPCHSPTQQRWFRLMASRVESGAMADRRLGAVVMHVDITEHKQALQRLEKLAFEDPLTGLWNRRGFTMAIDSYLHEQGWQEQALVVVLDIKALSNINDAHGYEVGDRLLAQVGHRFAQVVGHDRLGCTNGDSFLIFLAGEGSDSPEQHYHWLASLLDAPFLLNEIAIDVSARFGVTLLGEVPRDVEKLIHEAEAALFEVRDRGIRDWGLYTPELDHVIHERISLASDMVRALEEGQFELHFQPKVDLKTGKVIACESLLRWLHPERGMLSPGVFIPVAEQSQLIGPIGKWVLFEACRHLRAWQDANLEVVQVAVNVSVVQFELGGLLEQVREAITLYDIDPQSLIIEITESVYARQSKALLQQIHDLHEFGVRLSLDDFGTGYSSLLYLQNYPFDEIKIDMGFVRRIVEDDYSRRIVSTILGISQVMGADSVAEGIERPEVRDVLIDMGCGIGQGYYFSMPLAAEDFQWLLEKHATLPLSVPASTEPTAPAPSSNPSKRSSDDTSGR
ncbi:bifunctional diguanylate cyclase/phosphodiesterase [Halomonas aquatica]|uniref:EAL domain-containing protein n=1 Tax=Halomonas aquatica TaxID=3151123 RepID=A0ABV1NGK6_9GAMM